MTALNWIAIRATKDLVLRSVNDLAESFELGNIDSAGGRRPR
jgi:hypothetical protein